MKSVSEGEECKHAQGYGDQGDFPDPMAPLLSVLVRHSRNSLRAARSSFCSFRRCDRGVSADETTYLRGPGNSGGNLPGRYPICPDLRLLPPAASPAGCSQAPSQPPSRPDADGGRTDGES